MDEATQTIEKLDQLIARRSILEHPFYQAWRQGKLSREQLAIYAQMYYPHVAAFPEYLQTTIDGAADLQVRLELQDNLAEELKACPRRIPSCGWILPRGWGWSANEVTARPAHPAASQAVETFTRLAKESTPAGLAGLYAYESQQPEVARQKADGLRLLYGIADPPTLAYFEGARRSRPAPPPG